MYVYKLHAFCDDDAEGEDFCSYEEDPKNFGVSVRNVKILGVTYTITESSITYPLNRFVVFQGEDKSFDIRERGERWRKRSHLPLCTRVFDWMPHQ